MGDSTVVKGCVDMAHRVVEGERSVCWGRVGLRVFWLRGISWRRWLRGRIGLCRAPWGMRLLLCIG